MERALEVEITRPTGQEAPWVIPLPNHGAYHFVRLKRTFLSEDARHTVVIVDLKRLLACADRDTHDYVLPQVEHWPPGKIRGIRGFLDPSQERIPEMPYVNCSTRRSSSVLGALGLSREGVISFRNGQHRARYLQFAGALTLPVEVHETEALLVARYCGVVDPHGTRSDK